jgi:tetratricopeptide (TPR) repeat protein
MFFRRAFREVESAHRALAEGRYEAAFALLEHASKRQRGGGAQAQLELYLAAVYALYGQAGLADGLLHLHAAAEADQAVVEKPLYRALYWEFSAYGGDPAVDVRRGALTAASSGDAFATYHAAAALLAVGAYRRAAKVLRKLEPGALPDYLCWRYWSLLGRTSSQRGHWLGAAKAYRQAVAASRGRDRQGERLNLAASLLEADHAHEVLALLAEDDEAWLEGAERILHYHLKGRTQLQLGNPGQALNELLRARELERQGDAQADRTSCPLALSLAQAYAALGQLEQAGAAYDEAAALAPAEQRTLIVHEHSLLLLEADELLEAEALLSRSVRDDAYVFRAEAYADLAETTFRLGKFGEAAEFARRALDLGVVAPACLCLGQIAYEYYRFDAAIAYFEQAASATGVGEPDWILAQEMLADVLVQQGYTQPERIIRHAQAALKYLAAGSEWALILRGYLEQARVRLGGHSKVLN